MKRLLLALTLAMLGFIPATQAESHVSNQPVACAASPAAPNCPAYPVSLSSSSNSVQVVNVQAVEPALPPPSDPVAVIPVNPALNDDLMRPVSYADPVQTGDPLPTPNSDPVNSDPT